MAFGGIGMQFQRDWKSPTPPASTGDPLTDAINYGAWNANFKPPYKDQVISMLRAYAPVMGLNAQSNWAGFFNNTNSYQYGRYGDWGNYDNPSQTFFKVLDQNNLQNKDQVKSYVQGTSQYQQEAQSFTNAWNESNKSSGSFFNDVIPLASIAVAIAFPQLAGFIGEAMGFGAATSAGAIAAGNAVMAGGIAAVEGKSVNDILEAAAIGGVGSLAGGAASEAVGGGVPGAIASGATRGAIGATALGGDVSEAAVKGGAAAGLTAGIRDITATPGTAENIPGPATAEEPPIAPGQEPGDFAVYDQSGQALTPEQIAAQYPDLYPGGELPKAGEMTEYKPGSKGITLPSSLLARAFNVGLEAPTTRTAGGYGATPGATTGLFGGEGVSVTAPGRALGGGDVESPKTGGKRRNVWNVASLRNLQEGLGV